MRGAPRYAEPSPPRAKRGPESQRVKPQVAYHPIRPDIHSRTRRCAEEDPSARPGHDVPPAQHSIRLPPNASNPRRFRVLPAASGYPFPVPPLEQRLPLAADRRTALHAPRVSPPAGRCYAAASARPMPKVPVLARLRPAPIPRPPRRSPAGPHLSLGRRQHPYLPRPGRPRSRGAVAGWERPRCANQGDGGSAVGAEIARLHFGVEQPELPEREADLDEGILAPTGAVDDPHLRVAQRRPDARPGEIVDARAGPEQDCAGSAGATSVGEAGRGAGRGAAPSGGAATPSGAGATAAGAAMLRGGGASGAHAATKQRAGRRVRMRVWRCLPGPKVPEGSHAVNGDPRAAPRIRSAAPRGRPAVASHLLPRPDRMSGSISCRRHLHENVGRLAAPGRAARGTISQGLESAARIDSVGILRNPGMGVAMGVYERGGRRGPMSQSTRKLP